MDRVEGRFGESLEREFERLTRDDDDSAAREIWAAGMTVPIVRDDTPVGHVIHIHPDGREELVRVDREAAAKILGA